MKWNDKRRVKRTIRGTAKQFNIPPEQCRTDMQATIDAAWATTDPGAQAYQKQLFPAGKPTVEEFIAVLGRRVQNEPKDKEL
jgi:hypothetical protein